MRGIGGPLAASLLLAACAKARPVEPIDSNAPCASLSRDACTLARGLVAAAPSYQDEAHPLLLAGSIAPGRGVVRSAAGDRATDRACARVDASRPELDLGVLDYAFVGAAIDATLVSADANVAPLLASGEHRVALVALALVRERVPRPAIAPGPGVVVTKSGCACGDATHVAGETKWGALVAFEARAPRPTHPTRAIDLARAALVDPDARVTERRAGALAIDGLAPYLAGRAAKPLAFHVTEAAPIASALRPIAEACPGALAAPDVAPSPLDFGVAAYGVAAERTVRVVNRAAVDLDALVGASTVRVPARSAIVLPLAWTPDGDAWTCEAQTRDEAIRFVAAAPDASGARPEQLAHVLETVRTGRPTIARAERVEPGPSDERGAPLARDWSCAPDFVPSACRVERATCTPGPCAAATAEPTGGGCRFVCRARDGAACRFDAFMQCRLGCPE